MTVKSAEKLEGCRARLVAVVDAEAFASALNKAYGKQKNSIQLPGFRKGKAPRSLVEKMYGSDIFYDDAVELIAPETLSAALETAEASDLKFYGNPSISNYAVDDGAAEITFEFELQPEVTLGSYKGLQLTENDLTVTDEEVEEELKSMAKRNARIQTADRPIQVGDTAVLNFEGFVDDVAFDGGKGENYSLEIGSGSFIPGFEDQLVGVSAGESKDVAVTFPEDYQAADLAGKAAIFKCFVHEVKESILPEIDDEFAKDVSEFDTLEELKASTREKKAELKKSQAETNLKNQAVKEAAKNAEFLIPDGMYDAQVDVYLQNYEYQLAMNGIGLQDYLNMMGMDEAALRSGLRNNAIQEVKQSLTLEAIAEDADLTVSDEEIEAEYQRMADENDMEIDQVRQYVQVDSIRANLLNEKAVALIIENAELIPAAQAAAEVKAEMDKINAELAEAREAEAEGPEA